MKKPKWQCGMCKHINTARNRVKCEHCGCYRDLRVGHKENIR